MTKSKTPERLALEARADALEIAWGSNWKDETIADRIAEAEAAQAAGSGGEGEATEVPPPRPKVEIIGTDMAGPERRPYAALDPIRHGGTLYGPNAAEHVLFLTEAEARPLLDVKVIAAVPG